MKTLTYDGIRAELVASLKKNPVYKDFNFDASGISALVNFLAYNNHRFGYFAKMLLDESFIDSAHTLPAMLSHAKRLGYQARGSHAAAVVIDVVVKTDKTFTNDRIEVPRGTAFKSSNSSQDSRVFTVIDEQSLSFASEDADSRTYTGQVLAHEGTISSTTLDITASLISQQYAIDDPSADISTLRVFVKPVQSTVETRLERAASPQDINPDNPVYYTSLTKDSTVALIMSETYPQGSKVRAEFLSTNGESGNGAKIFSFAKKLPRSSIDINNFTTVTCSVDSPSQGGANPQSTEELRAAIPQAWRRQNRAVTSDDIASIIREEFGDISTVSVWGGEEEKRRRYGKKFICVVPKSSRVLSLGGRREIARLLSKYSIPGDDLVFVDAVQQLVDIVVTVKRLPTASTDDEIKNAVLAVIDDVTGIASGSSVLDFSSYAISNEIANKVPDVAQAFPSISFYNEVTFADTSVVELEFRNDVHAAPVVTSTVAVTVSQPSSSVIALTPAGPGKAVVVTTPVVPELQVSRNQYFEVRSRKVKVVR